ncbi:MAG: hypothetical protein FWC03_02145 [Treponema sp.]|nr:hypothetical protein [Treponema sp.]
MNKKNIIKIAVPLIILIIIAVPVLYFFSLPPVLIVTDHSFALLYNESRIKKDLASSSIALFRPVKTVDIADDVSADIIQYAIAEVSAAPFCVIFSLRFAQAARMYREQNPGIPVVILEGRYPENANPAVFGIGSGNNDDYFIFKTDIIRDFYIAGQAASILDGDKNGRIAVLMEPGAPVQAREAFTQALIDLEKPLQTSFYTSYNTFSSAASRRPDFSCVVLAGIGSEYLENQINVPIIFFSWMNLEYLPDNVVMVFNDSPFVQAVKAVEMVAAGTVKGQILSRREIIIGDKIGKDTIQKLQNIGKIK